MSEADRAVVEALAQALVSTAERLREGRILVRCRGCGGPVGGSLWGRPRTWCSSPDCQAQSKRGTRGNAFPPQQEDG